MKRYFIKFVAVLMAVVVLAMSPASDYLDTQGIGQTNAAATTVITIGALLGALAGAYGIYIAADKLDAEGTNWLNWTKDNDVDSHKSLQDIALGVTTYTVSKQVINSAKNYLSTKESEELDILAYGSASAYDTLPNTNYTSSFLDYYYANLHNENYSLFITFEEASNPSVYPSGFYTVFSVASSMYWRNNFDNALSDSNVSDIVIFSESPTSSGSMYFGFYAFDNVGLPLYSGVSADSPWTYNFFDYQTFYYSSGKWIKDSGDCRAFIKDFVFDSGYVKTIKPFYRTDLKYSAGLDKQSLVDSSYVVKNATIDYSLAGSKANANVKALTGSVVTQGQLQTIHEAANTGVNNVVNFPSGDSNNNNNIDTKALSDAISLAVAKALLEAGIGNSGSDSGDDTGTDSESSAEQVGVLRQILNAITDNSPIASLREIIESMGYHLGNITTSIGNVLNSIAENSPVPTLREINELLGNTLGNIKTSINGVIDAIGNTSPLEKLESIGTSIKNLPVQIVEGITNSLSNMLETLFVPDTDALQDRVDGITDKFSFADSLVTLVDDIRSALSNASGPPVIYIHFEDSEDSKYASVGTLKLLSFEWYERYKPCGDALLSASLWLFFLWGIRKRLAEIVQGISSPGVSDAESSVDPAIGVKRGYFR